MMFLIVLCFIFSLASKKNFSFSEKNFKMVHEGLKMNKRESKMGKRAMF